MARDTNDTVITNCSKRVKSIQKYLKGTKVELPFQGRLVKPAVLAAVFQKAIDARQAVNVHQAAYKAAVKDRDETDTDRLAAEESLKGWVLARYGAGSTEANEFGYAGRKVTDVPADVRAAAVVKRKATRKARNTMGKKQRLKVKGAPPTAVGPAAANNTTPAPATVVVMAAPTMTVPGVTPVTASAPAAATDAPAAAPAPAVVGTAPTHAA
ncbi:MAG TPA: hypothetical protein VGI39_36870 [Polyangiaceae bacterium]|jgi:hypothetical protein